MTSASTKQRTNAATLAEQRRVEQAMDTAIQRVRAASAPVVLRTSVDDIKLNTVFAERTLTRRYAVAS